jgi:hypothetical protein
MTESKSGVLPLHHRAVEGQQCQWMGLWKALSADGGILYGEMGYFAIAK